MRNGMLSKDKQEHRAKRSHAAASQMSISKAQDEQAGEQFENDQPPWARLVVDRGEDHLREPLVIDPELCPRCDTSSDRRWTIEPASQDVLAEANVAPEVRVGDGVGKPESDESDEQACRTQT